MVSGVILICIIVWHVHSYFCFVLEALLLFHLWFLFAKASGFVVIVMDDNSVDVRGFQKEKGWEISLMV